MPIFELDPQDIRFPPPELADQSGILAVGGDLSPERVLASYYYGVFHWFNEDDPILWWSPDPRLVLFPDRLHISKSMRPILRQPRFQVTHNQSFKEVISACQQTSRPNQDDEGSWISQEIIEVYCDLHQRGFAHSIEVWSKEQQLVGGLYGIILGKCFFGESMFSKVSNASKAGFITLVHNLKKHDCQLIDCQVESSHLISLGAENIPRQEFLGFLDRNFDETHIDLSQDFTTDVL